MNDSQTSETRSRNERALYDGAKKALTAYLRQAGDQFPITLEVTADGFSQAMQTLLRDELLFLLDNKELRPDIFGEVGPNATEMYGRSKFVIAVEVKPYPVRIRDVFQAKMYGEVYQAYIALLMSPESPEERVVRLLQHRPDLLSYSAGYARLHLCTYSEQGMQWWPRNEEPRLRK